MPYGTAVCLQGVFHHQHPYIYICRVLFAVVFINSGTTAKRPDAPRRYNKVRIICV